MKRSNSQTTYCSEAEEVLMRNGENNVDCNNVLPRRSKRRSQKPTKLNGTTSWDDISLFKRKKRVQNSEGSSQFLTEKIDDCSLKENGEIIEQSIRPAVFDNEKKRYVNQFQSIDLIAELESPQFSDQLPQNQMLDPTNMVISPVTGYTPVEFCTQFRSLISSNDTKVQMMNKRKITNPELQNIVNVETTDRYNIGIPNIQNACNASEPLIQKAQCTVNKKPTKRHFSVSQPIDLTIEPTQKKKSVISATKKSGTVQKSARGRKRKNCTEDLEQVPCNTAIQLLSVKSDSLLPEVSPLIPDISTTMCEPTIPLNNPSFKLQNDKKRKNQFNSAHQETSETKKSETLQKSIRGRKRKNCTEDYQQQKFENAKTSFSKEANILNEREQVPFNTTRQLLLASSDSLLPEVSPLIHDISTTMCETVSLNNPSFKLQNTKKQKNHFNSAHQEINEKFGPIPKITTIPILPATTDSLLPKVYPPHFTGQLPAPIPEPMSARQLKNAANFTETQLILHSDRELNYWLTPDLTQSFDEDMPSSSTPSLSDSLKGIFEAETFREILQIEKIVYRLEDNHVKALAMILNTEVEILHKILKHIVRLDEHTLKKINNMLKPLPPPVEIFDICNSSERVEPNEMITSPISSSSVELIESPKNQESRIFQSQRHKNVN